MVEDDSAKYTLTAGKEWFCITCGHREYRGETPSFRSKEYSRDEQFGGSWAQEASRESILTKKTRTI